MGLAIKWMNFAVSSKTILEWPDSYESADHSVCSILYFVNQFLVVSRERRSSVFVWYFQSV